MDYQEYIKDGEQWAQDEARELAYELLTQMEWEQEEREELPKPRRGKPVTRQDNVPAMASCLGNTAS